VALASTIAVFPRTAQTGRNQVPDAGIVLDQIVNGLELFQIFRVPLDGTEG
jgi:hypothetical protein